jgi:hypothetical protein
VFFSRLVIPLKIPSYPFAARCPIFCMGHMMDKKTGCERHMTDKWKKTFDSALKRAYYFPHHLLE